MSPLGFSITKLQGEFIGDVVKVFTCVEMIVFDLSILGYELLRRGMRSIINVSSRVDACMFDPKVKAK